jgi:murein L,D-transpeptidase YcbB/YkuD
MTIHYWVSKLMRLKKGYRTGLAILLVLSALSVTYAATLTLEKRGLVTPIQTALPVGVDFDWVSLERFYQTQGHRFVWHDNEQLNPNGRLLFEWLAASVEEGLNPSDYYVDHLRYLTTPLLPGHYFLRELMLTEGYLRLASDLRLGSVDPNDVDPQWLLPADPFDPLDQLVKALQADDLARLLLSFKPSNQAYSRLTGALNHYRAIEVFGGWHSLPGDQVLRPGDSHTEVAALRERLAIEQRRQRLSVDDPNYFDQGLAADLRQFQRRFGLQDDGILGKATRQALNVPVASRIAQIRVNLERWRWLPNELASRYLLVNTAGFEIVLIDQGRTLFHRRTINGSRERQTPSFNSQITHLVFNPHWTIPRSIAVKDILPKLQSDSGYLERRRIKVLQRKENEWQAIDPAVINWLAYHERNFPFVLQQQAGAGNSLGRIKFHMPNQYDIYLHDTSAPGLFKRQTRALSSGCVRVESADQLAKLLMEGKGDQGIQIDRMLDSDQTHTTSLIEPIPIYLTYFTSWVDESGQVHFRPDVYRRNWRLMMAIGEGMAGLAADSSPTPSVGASL